MCFLTHFAVIFSNVLLKRMLTNINKSCGGRLVCWLDSKISLSCVGFPSCPFVCMYFHPDLAKWTIMDAFGWWYSNQTWTVSSSLGVDATLKRHPYATHDVGTGHESYECMGTAPLLCRIRTLLPKKIYVCLRSADRCLVFYYPDPKHFYGKVLLKSMSNYLNTLMRWPSNGMVFDVWRDQLFWQKMCLNVHVLQVTANAFYGCLPTSYSRLFWGKMLKKSISEPDRPLMLVQGMGLQLWALTHYFAVLGPSPKYLLLSTMK